METKHCPGCDTERPTEEFHRVGYLADGSPRLRKLCKHCDPRVHNLAEDRNDQQAEQRRARDRARKRAWLRLARLHPDDFDRIYQQELQEEQP